MGDLLWKPAGPSTNATFPKKFSRFRMNQRVSTRKDPLGYLNNFIVFLDQNATAGSQKGSHLPRGTESLKVGLIKRFTKSYDTVEV